MATTDVARTASVEVFNKAVAYLRHEISLRDLYEWMGRHTTWLMTAPRDDGTELAGLIELNLAEIEAGHATEEDLRREIEQKLTAHSPVTSNPTYRFNLSTADRAESSSVTIEVPIAPVWEASRPRFADIRFVTASS